LVARARLHHAQLRHPNLSIWPCFEHRLTREHGTFPVRHFDRTTKCAEIDRCEKSRNGGSSRTIVKSLFFVHGLTPATLASSKHQKQSLTPARSRRRRAGAGTERDSARAAGAHLCPPYSKAGVSTRTRRGLACSPSMRYTGIPAVKAPPSARRPD
jgi:hypothetical protein